MKLKFTSKLFVPSMVFLLVFSFSSFALAQEFTGTLLIADNPDPNVFTITGTGFNANETVNITLCEMDGTTVIQAYTATTDGEGNFITTITVAPVPRSGFYPFFARTSSVTGTTMHLLLSQADQQPATPGPVERSLTVSPDNSNIFNVLGVGFGASKDITLSLRRPQGLPVYTFPMEISTDSEGRFSVIVIVPTSLNGSYNLVAKQSGSTLDASVEVTIPNLRGPAGPSGEPGPTGQPGPTGEQGAAGPSGQGGTTDLAIIASLALSVVAIAISVFTLLKRR